MTFIIRVKKIEYINTKLDPFQREAVKKGITNNHITLIQGPPGTGKTSVITEIVQQIIKENKNSGVSNYKRILLVSKNNKAVDNVLNKLNEIIDKNVIMIRIGREEKITDKTKIVKPKESEFLGFGFWNKEGA